jgi:cysteine desulfurase
LVAKGFCDINEVENQKTTIYCCVQHPTRIILAIALVLCFYLMNPRSQLVTHYGASSMKKVYLDYNASTPIAPEVAQAMEPFLAEHYGNPSSRHWAGIPANEGIERARTQVAQLLGSSATEIVFTSGGTEANNHAILGAYFASNTRDGHIITTQIEHPAVIEPCRFLERLGATVTYLPVDRTGMVDPDDVRNAITPKTILITVMHANNEVGTVQPIAEISRIAHDNGVLVHTDAAQSVGKVPTKVSHLGVDMLSVAGHKLYGPKGVGAIYIRDGVELEPFMHGAGHESGRRAGTENLLLDVGLGAACELARTWSGVSDMVKLRDSFWNRLQDSFGDSVALNGHISERLPNTLNVSFVGKVGSDILDQLEGVAASTGSACHEGTVELSPVLSAMGVSAEVGMGAIRFSFGRATTKSDVVYVMDRLAEIMRHSEL